MCVKHAANSQRNRQAHRGLAKIAVLAAASALLIGILGGCYGVPPKPLKPESDEERFAGLGIALDSSGPEHVVIVQTPTAGYQCTVDYVAESFEGRDIYILIREPNPLYVYSTSNHPARVLTGVDSRTFVRVLAQQLPHGVKVKREGYRVVSVTAPDPSTIKNPTVSPSQDQQPPGKTTP
jgi:hypothetical protein